MENYTVQLSSFDTRLETLTDDYQAKANSLSTLLLNYQSLHDLNTSLLDTLQILQADTSQLSNRLAVVQNLHQKYASELLALEDRVLAGETELEEKEHLLIQLEERIKLLQISPRGVLLQPKFIMALGSSLLPSFASFNMIRLLTITFHLFKDFRRSF